MYADLSHVLEIIEILLGIDHLSRFVENLPMQFSL